MQRRYFIGGAMLTASCATPASVTEPNASLHFEVYSKSGRWRWRLKARNGRCIAHSGEAYQNKAACLAALALVRNSATAPIEEADTGCG